MSDRATKRREEREAKAFKKHKKEGIKAAIKMINDVVMLKLDKSEVHGVGVFAMRNIKKGKKVYATAIPCLVDIPYEEFEKIKPEISQNIIEKFPQVKNGSHFMAPDTLMQMYTNHSEDPNYDPKLDIAIKDIKKGEELLEDYTNCLGWQSLFPWILENVDNS